MTRIKLTLNTLIFGLILIAASSMVQAQATRTWISGVGDDMNPCSRTSPCKTWAGAYSKTATGGEIDSIDANGAGTLSIGKSITIDGGGTFSSGLASGTYGFLVNAPGSHVVIRNVSINGAGTGLDGIRVLQVSSLVVENVHILGFTGMGIKWAPSTADGSLTVKNASIENCTAGGISVINTSGFGRASIENSTFQRGAFGVQAGSLGIVTVTNSTANATTDGFLANGGGAQLNLDRCVSTNNTNGVKVDNGAAARISNCQISTNTSNGLKIVSGIIESYGTNMIRGNPLSDAPTGVMPG